jgi:hypothetical protein
MKTIATTLYEALIDFATMLNEYRQSNASKHYY